MTKRTPKLRVIFIFILVFLLIFSANINFDFISQRENNFGKIEAEIEPKLKGAGHWNLLLIIISGNSGWDTINSTYEWCSGSGTEEKPYIIENVTVDAQKLGIGIDIRYSSVFFIIRNCTVYNSGVGEDGINLYYVNNGKITNNNISFNDDHGLFIHGGGGYCTNFVISNNIISNNRRAGISFEAWIDNSTISGNTIFNNGQDGICLRQDCDNNTIQNNTVRNNGYSGILLQGGSDNNVVKENNVSDSNFEGIYVYGNSSYNTIKRNNISKSGSNGIHIEESPSNTFMDNIILDNNLDGVRFKAWSGSPYKNTNNTITSNIIKGNLGKGASIDEASFSNLIYFNEFINNNIKTEDNGMNNQWDNGSIGNYWDDYGGADADEDGIGDTPYNISGTAGSHDNYPIWWDPPKISIISPIANETFGKNAPEYNLSLEGVPHTMWCEIEGISGNLSITDLTGTIDQDAWNNLTEGDITITFYAQDSRGEIGSESIVVKKNIPSTIPGYNLFFLLGIISVVAIIITKKVKKTN